MDKAMNSKQKCSDCDNRKGYEIIMENKDGTACWCEDCWDSLCEQENQENKKEKNKCLI